MNKALVFKIFIFTSSKYFWWSALCFALAFCISCASVSVVRLSSEVREESTSVKVFRNFEVIPWEFEEIALIIVDDQGSEYSEAYLIDKLILKAKELGADGLVLGDRSESTAGGMGGMGGSMLYMGTFQRKVVRGTAIARIR